MPGIKRSEYRNALRQVWANKEDLEEQMRRDTGERYKENTYANCIYLVQQGKLQDVANMVNDVIQKLGLNSNKPADLYKACAIKFGLPTKFAQIWSSSS